MQETFTAAMKHASISVRNHPLVLQSCQSRKLASKHQALCWQKPSILTCQIHMFHHFLRMICSRSPLRPVMAFNYSKWLITVNNWAVFINLSTFSADFSHDSFRENLAHPIFPWIFPWNPWIFAHPHVAPIQPQPWPSRAQEGFAEVGDQAVERCRANPQQGVGLRKMVAMTWDPQISTVKRPRKPGILMISMDFI